MNIHEVCNIFPDMNDSEFKALKEDIQRNGLLEAIWTYREQIVDGRHRYKACTELGIEPRFREWSGDGRLIDFVVSLNLSRRHLTESQRSMIAGRIANMERTDTLTHSRSANLQNDDKVSQSDAAAAVNVSTRSVASAKKVLERGTPELIAAVDSGKVSVSKAAKIADKEPAQQKKALEQKSTKAPIKTKDVYRVPKEERMSASFEQKYKEFFEAMMNAKMEKYKQTSREACLRCLENLDALLTISQ